MGFFLVALGLLLTITFALFSLVVKVSNPYLAIVGFMILPGIFGAGLVIVPVGMLIRLLRLRRRARKHRLTFHLPRVDLNNTRTRAAVGGFLAFSIFVVLPVLAVSSYEGYHFTESTSFCGQVCHSVMEPQATAHASSPHARVTCANCHIGAGASWFVKSKVSGARQVLAVWFDTYSVPIPPAITELRPARETCETCHWPAMFYGSRYRERVYFSPDESNTRRVVRMLLKVGGADRTIGRIEGIHMHMVTSARIEYVALDSNLQHIPWVRYTGQDGQVRVYRSDGQPADAPPPPGIRREVDCMDCHNRGAHHFRSPQKAVDLALNVGWIDPTLPYVKRQAVRALLSDWKDAATAELEIPAMLAAFYEQEFPAVARERAGAVRQAGLTVAGIYRRHFFPRMRVDWRTYPENVGHLESPGCFRCHDGLHVDADGHAIGSACDSCHDFLNPAAARPDVLEIGAFRHSMPMAAHQNLRCDQCHSGGELRLCRDCHWSGDWTQYRGRGEFRTPTPWGIDAPGPE